MSLNKNYKDIAARAFRTFVTSATAVLVLGTVGLPACVVVGLISALFSVGMNLFNISPVSSPGRGASTFLQTFLSTWAVTGYELSTGTLVSAGAAALTAFVNFVRATA